MSEGGDGSKASLPDPAHDPAEKQYTIGELAEAFGISTRAIRFYEHRKLLSPGRQGANRFYTRRDRARLALILRGKNLGFTLEDIGEYLSLYDTDPGQLAQTQLLLDKVEAHRTMLIEKRTDIERTLGELEQIATQCRSHLAATGATSNAGRMRK
jgi:DNA-binding transcriptional MerR regulator